jgi:phospholipase C
VVDEVFEHASIPATVTDYFLGKYDDRSPREKAANLFLESISLKKVRAEDDCPVFALD